MVVLRGRYGKHTISSGMTNRAVARALWVTMETVKFHLSNVCREPGVGSRVEAAAGVHENGVDGLERGRRTGFGAR
jgi:DNA-binding CsgD family transcriptional regulator